MENTGSSPKREEKKPKNRVLLVQVLGSFVLLAVCVCNLKSDDCEYFRKKLSHILNDSIQKQQIIETYEAFRSFTSEPIGGWLMGTLRDSGEQMTTHAC